MNYPVVLLGAGGHAKVLIDILLEQNVKIIGASVPEPDKFDKIFCGIPIIGNDDEVTKFNCDKIELVNGIGSVGSTALRKSIYEKFKSLGYRFRKVIHSAAIVSREVFIQEGVEIAAGAVINIGTFVGANSIINTNSSVDHDCKIGKNVHIAPGVTLSGNVTIGDGTHIGAGSTIIQGVTIGSESIIGAGSLVLHDIGDKNLAYGVPATVKKSLESV